MVPIREPKTYSILLADDLTLVREGLAALCEAQPHFRVVGQCSEGAAALRMMAGSAMLINNRRNIPSKGRRRSRLLKRGIPSRRQCYSARRIRGLWPSRQRKNTNQRRNSIQRDLRLRIKGHGETRREQPSPPIVESEAPD